MKLRIKKNRGVKMKDNLRIYITDKTYNELSGYNFNFDLITKKNIEYFIISNNKKIFYTNDKFYIKNSNDKSELNFEISSIEFNDKFCNFIDNIYKTSIEELNKIFYSASNNLYFQEKQKGSLLSGINSTIFKY